jgi:hypothetical protein
MTFTASIFASLVCTQRVCKFMLPALVVLVGFSCGPKPQGAFSDTIAHEYASMATLREETQQNPNIAGKAVLINIGESLSHSHETASTKDESYDIEAQTVSSAQKKIHQQIQAENPSEVGTVVLLKWAKDLLSTNIAGIEFVRVRCEVIVVDNIKHVIVGKRQFAGSNPEGLHRWGSSPENEIVEYINSLPRSGRPPEAVADRGSSTEPPSAQTPESFAIKALLVDAEDKPITGEAVHCLVYQDGKSYAQLSSIDGRIVPGGPKGISDGTGSLDINVGGDFLKNGTKDFNIGAVRDGKVIGVLRDGKLFHFTLDQVRKANNKLDLGKVTLQTK